MILSGTVLVLSLLGAEFEWPGAVEIDAADLTSLDRSARLRAVERAASSGTAEAKGRLIPLLQDPDGQVRVTAGRVLARAGVMEAIDAATRWITSRSPQERPLGLEVLREATTLTPAARRAVERGLLDGEATVRLLAIEALAKHELGPSFIAVTGAADDDLREVRLRAVRLLEQAGDPRATLPLIARLIDSDRAVRIEAIRALGGLGDPRAGPALKRQLAEATDDIRVVAVDSLGRLKIASAVPALGALARRRPADEVVRHAQLALGHIATPEAIAVLIDELRQPPVLEEVKEGLRRAGPLAVPALVSELAGGTATSSATAAALLGRIGDRRATKPLVAVLQRHETAAAAAIAALAVLKDPEAVPALVHAAGDPSAELRRLCYEALAAIGDDRALVLLERGLPDPAPEVRMWALRLAGVLGPRASSPEILVRLQDPDPGVRREAVAATLRLRIKGKAAVGGLLAAAEREARLPSPAVQDQAALGDALEAAVDPSDGPALAAALRRTRGPGRAPILRALAAAHAQQPLVDDATIDLLLVLVDEGGPIGELAADGLGVSQPKSNRETPLLRAYGDAEPSVRGRLCAALARLQTPAAVERLRTTLLDDDGEDDVRAAAAWASGSLGKPPLREALIKVRDALSPAVAANARTALARGAGPRADHKEWIGVRLLAPDGTPHARRWVAVTARDGTTTWSMTGVMGETRVFGLPVGPYQIELKEPGLIVRTGSAERGGPPPGRAAPGADAP